MAKETIKKKKAKSIALGDLVASSDFLQAKSKITYDVLFSREMARSFLTLK